MSITTALASVVGALSSPYAIAGTTLLTGANTVMNAVELKNDYDIKAGISSANSKLQGLQDSLDELQGICADVCTVDDIESLFDSTPTSNTTTAVPTANTTAPVNEIPEIPDWAETLFAHQKEQDAFLQNIATMLKKPDDSTPTSAIAAPTGTTVNVNAAPTTTPPVSETAVTSATKDEDIPSWFKAYLATQEAEKAKVADKELELKTVMENLLKATAELKAETEKGDNKKK